MSTEAFRLEPEFPDEDQQAAKPEEGILVIDNIEQIPLAQEAMVIASHMGRITRKLNVEMQRLEETGLAIAQALDGIKATDQTSYTELCERLTDTKQFLDRVEEFAEPWRNLFYRPYKAILERTTTITLAPTVAHQKGKNRRLDFERAVKAAADAETMRLQKEQREREEKQRLDAAVQAEQLGLSEAAVETILTQPSTAPAPVAIPSYTRPTGTRKIPQNWQAELADKAVFWAWCKKQKDMPAMLTIDQPSLNREAKTHRATLGQRYPGLRAVNRGGD